MALRGAAAAVFLTLALTACGGVSEADLQQARDAGAQEQVQKEAANRQSEAQASLEDQVAQLQEEADAAKAAEAQAAADAKAKAKADADAKAKAKADADAKAKAAAKKKASANATAKCSDRVSAGPHTSCAFALLVENAFYEWGGGNQALNVYSPVTGLWYIMTCQAGVPTVCRGGAHNNAVVYIR